MREGLRSGKKLASPNLDDKGLVKDPVKIKNPEFGTEIEQSPVGSTVAKPGGRGRRGKKRKNVEVVSDARKVAEPKDVQDDGKATFDGNAGIDVPFKEGNCEFNEKNDPSLNEKHEMVLHAKASAVGDGDIDMTLNEADEGTCKYDEKIEASLKKHDEGDEAAVDAEVSVDANGDGSVDAPTKEADKGNCDSDEKKMVPLSNVHESDEVVVSAVGVVAYGDIDKHVKKGGDGIRDSDEKKEDSLNKLDEACEVVAGAELSLNANRDDDSRVDTPSKDAAEGNCESDKKKEVSLIKVHEGDEVVGSAKANDHANDDVDMPLKDADEGNCQSDVNKDASLNKLLKGNKVVSVAEVCVNVNGDADASIDTPSKSTDCEADEKKDASSVKLLEGDETVDVSVNGDVDASVDAPLKEANGGNRESDEKKDVEACADSLEDVNTVRKGKRGRKKKIVGLSNYSEVNEENCENDNMELPTGSFGTCGGMQEVAKGRQGRKRKSIESSECTYDDDDCDRKKMAKDCTGQVARRVLRSTSGTCEEKVNAKNDEESLNLGSSIALTSKVQERNLALVDDKTDMEEDEKPQCTGRPKKLKGRRGRPPKVNRDNGASGEEAIMEKDEESQHPGSPITITSSRGRLCKVRERNLALVDDKTDTEDDEEPQRISRPKKLKGRRGRPPKVNRDNGASGEDDFATEKDERPQKIGKTEKLRGHCGRLVLKHGKSKGSRLVNRDIIKSRVQKVQGSLKVNIDKKEMVMGTEEASSQSQTKSTIQCNESKKNGIREEKQLVREKIIHMLLGAGWTIDYRQRHGREYRDAVYVDCEKKAYWSVTLAYRKLKEKVESGKADSKAVSAFEPIPDEILSKLFRVTVKGKKSKKVATNCNETEQDIEGEQSSKKKYSTKKGVGHKGKKSSAGPGEETSKRRTKGVKSQSVQKDSSSNHRRGMSGSNRETRKGRKPYSLLARSSAKVSNPESGGFILHNGKRSIWSWMIDLGTVLASAKVKYIDSMTKKIMVEGKITRDGILCGCCNNVIAISEFVSHTGISLAHDSHIYNDIYLGTGISLSQCLWNSWSKQAETDPIRFCCANVDGDDPNDDTCNICADGGNLICCDGCPSTFHQSCLDFEKFPSGDWRCLHCVCKFCKTIGGRISERDGNYKNPSGLLSCSLCKEKVHQSCAFGEDAEKINPNSPFFCGSKCQEIFERLQVLIGVKHQIEDGFSWTLLRYSDVGQDSSLICYPKKLECNAKLAVAFSIMDECFCPIIDERTKINTIHNVVYSCGSNIKRLDFSGFLTIVLERGDEITAAASIRIHGDQLAEMPFIGTRHMYRRQGMCRRLVNTIEMVLCSLDVGKLVIPAISELNHTWTSVFGFSPREESTRKSMRHLSVIVFPGTDMLEKPIPKDMIAKCNLIPAAESTDLNMEHDAPDNLHMCGSDTNALQDKIMVSNVCQVNDDTVADESIVDPPDSSADLASNSGSVLPLVSADKKLCLDHLSLSVNGKVETVSAGSACSYLEHGLKQTPMNMTECSNTISDVTTVLPDKTMTNIDLDSEGKTYPCSK